MAERYRGTVRISVLAVAGLGIVAGGPACGAGEGDCQDDADCAFLRLSEPVGPFCVAAECADCRTDADCGTGASCSRRNQCIACRGDADCDDDALCEDGRCRRPCETDDDCPRDRQRCLPTVPDGALRCVGVECRVDDDCFGIAECVDDRCTASPRSEVRMRSLGEARISVTDPTGEYVAEARGRSTQPVRTCRGSSPLGTSCIAEVVAGEPLTFMAEGLGETPIFAGWCNGCAGEPQRFGRTLGIDEQLLCVAATMSDVDPTAFDNLLSDEEAAFEVFPRRAGIRGLAAGEWRGDQTTLVEAENGIAPRSGTRMVRCDASSSSGPGRFAACDLVRAFDLAMLRSQAGVEDGEPLDVVLWAHVNRVAGPDSEQQFFVLLQWWRGVPSDRRAGMRTDANRAGYRCADDDPETWERVAVRASIPDLGPDPSWLEVFIGAAENVSNDSEDEFTGHYLDDVGIAVAVE